MSALLVDNIVTGASDSLGSVIETVYAKVKTRYAVYRNAEQVLIQFADDDAEGVNQRAALTPLFPVRSRISAMTKKLRTQQNSYQSEKAEEYDRRLAGGLLMALQGDVESAKSELAGIVADMAEDAASDTRTWHILYASIATLVVILLSWILSTEWFGKAIGTFSEGVSPNYWTAAAVGAIGALFSIALALRERSLPVDLQKWDNASDAVSRILVGAISGTVLIALLRSDFISLSVGGTALDSDNSVHVLVVAAFIGGFIQRFVADFLGGFAIASKSAGNSGVMRGAKANSADEKDIAKGKATEPDGRSKTNSSKTDSAKPVSSKPDTPEEGGTAEGHEAEAEPDDDQAEATDSPNRNPAEPVG